MKKSFAIGIPTLNRKDLLEQALSNYVQDFPFTQIHIVDNGNQGIVPPPNVTVHVMPENIGVAASWNFLCREIFKTHTCAYILNDDIYWGQDEKCISLFEKNCSLRLGLLKAPEGWCSFRITKYIFERVGDFDENFFPAYFEDNDYSYRLSLLKRPPIGEMESIMLSTRVFRKSQTLQKNKSVNQNFLSNRQYYIKKWGGEPDKEIYTRPFNGANKKNV